MKSRRDFKTELEYIKYLRIHLAGLAMQGLLSNEYIAKLMELPKHNPTQDISAMAIKFADELLKQLDQK